jgi:hypothetical protein
MKGEARKDERFEKIRWTVISISASQLDRCIFDDVHSESVNLGGGLTQPSYTNCIFQDCDFGEYSDSQRQFMDVTDTCSHRGWLDRGAVLYNTLAMSAIIYSPDRNFDLNIYCPGESLKAAYGVRSPEFATG